MVEGVHGQTNMQGTAQSLKLYNHLFSVMDSAHGRSRRSALGAATLGGQLSALQSGVLQLDPQSL